MRVGVNKAGEYDFAGAIDLVDMHRFRREEFVLRDFVGRTDGDDLVVGDEHRAVFNDTEFAHLRGAAWLTKVAGERWLSECKSFSLWLEQQVPRFGRRGDLARDDRFIVCVSYRGPSTPFARCIRSGLLRSG